MWKLCSLSVVLAVCILSAPVVLAVQISPTEPGSLWTWGRNTYAEALGYPTKGLSVPHATPYLLFEGNVTSAAAASEFSLAVVDGQLWTWGANGNGQLGNGTTTSSSVPTPPTFIRDGVRAVAAGTNYSMVLTSDGAVLVAGYAKTNYDGGTGNGGLGTGQGSNSGTNLTALTPVTNMGSGVTAIAAGSDFCLAVKDGALWAWGSNSSGQLGNGTSSNVSVATPVQVQGISGEIKTITAGMNTSFAIAGESNTLYMWGSNQYAQVGDATFASGGSPSYITTATPVMDGVTAVATSTAGGAMLAVKDGNVWAWGANSTWTASVTATPEQIFAGTLTNIVDVAIAGPNSLYPNNSYTYFALDANGDLWAWGFQRYGLLGTEDVATDTLLTTPMIVASGIGAISTSNQTVLAYGKLPEPATMSLLALGGLAMLRRRK